MSEIDILSFGETMAMLVAEQTGDLAKVEQFHKRIAALGFQRRVAEPGR
jgi:dehydrogluconokinase